jgi:hypothetical protein
MIKLKIISGTKPDLKSIVQNDLSVRVSAESLNVQSSEPIHRWKNLNNDEYILIGRIIGFRSENGIISEKFSIKSEEKVLEDFNLVSKIEGRFVVVKLGTDGTCEIWTDNFGRVDVYWQNIGNVIILSTSLDLLPISQSGGAPDLVGIMHSLTVYGSRPAKKHTIYKDVNRLGVNEKISLKNGKLEIVKRAFKPKSTIPLYQENDLHKYADHFLEAIRARASSDGNIVYLSSGWDSTSILASLVHLFGKSKTRCIIGRMRYADRSGVINQFEIDRAKAVADYFGVRLDIIELDYRTNAESILGNLKGLFRSQQFANMTGVNHWRLAEETAKTAYGNEVIFAGEMSDGAHNLGFSQFATIFHPASQDFREYSDKMASYLFGPTFLQQLQNGAHHQDPVWQLFKEKYNTTKFEDLAEGNLNITKQVLSNFFFRGGRVPLYSLDNNTMLTNVGKSKYSTESESVYINEIVNSITPDNLYAHYLQLYNSFHWQGSTVATLEHTAEAHGLSCVIPFHDRELIEFLSGMPESWGRGLDLKNTKYPLKWMLKNRVDYPIHLQVGPHSYTYDVNPNFTLLGEILHASSFKHEFQKALKKGKFVDWLDSDAFNKGYINQIIQRYLNGEELIGSEMNDLGVVALHSTIGVYGDE